MFDIGWSEMGLILLVALIVIGPKDLPRVAREIGKWTSKARSMAREFQRSLDDMAREAELQDIKAELQKVSKGGISKSIRDMVDPDGDIERAVDPNKPLNAPKPAPPPAAAAAAPAAPAEPAAIAEPAAATPVATPVVAPAAAVAEAVPAEPSKPAERG
ncbi:MAG: Sec-independent protein translocase protein TatB [Geminicoccaceae bacterium]